ncbi:hypothetical protein [Geodermatophilus sp. SYSU D00700]
MTTLEPTATPDPRAGLLSMIEARRASTEAYVREKTPVSNRLSTINIVSSAVVAALTAGPALGGTGFAETVQRGLSLDTSAVVWGVLCLGALVVSVTAAVSANLEKSSDLQARIGAAQAAAAMLAGLQARLQYGRLAVEEATEEYRDVLAGISFVPEADAGAAPGTAPAGRRERRVAWQLGVVVVAALLLGVTFVGYVRGAVATAPGGDGASAAPTASAAPAPTAAPTSSPEGPAAQGVFGGRVEEGPAVVAILVGVDEVIAYVCDGRQFEAWLQGSLADGRLELTGRDGAVLTGAVGDGAVSGRLRTAALDTPFTATVAAAPAGVYEARIQVDGTEARVGWAVLPDEQQVGLVTVAPGTDPSRRGAPPLDLTDLTFVFGGTEHRAERLDV